VLIMKGTVYWDVVPSSPVETMNVCFKVSLLALVEFIKRIKPPFSIHYKDFLQ
jgi:hypothetical protein